MAVAFVEAAEGPTRARDGGGFIAAVRRHGGRQVKVVGERTLMVFESPASALAAASEILAGLSGVGIPARSGVHVGTVSVTQGDLRGTAVNVAARATSIAPHGLLYATSTVRALVPEAAWGAASTYELKGVGGWELSELRAPPPAPRAGLRTGAILVTDIVGSSQQAVVLGDANWSILVGRHDAVVRRAAWRWRGQEVASTGDGFVLSFDDPADAAGCGLELVENNRELGLTVRVGIDAFVGVGEGPAQGLADEVADIAAAATKGGLVVSPTVAEVLVGSELEFEALPNHSRRLLTVRARTSQA